MGLLDSMLGSAMGAALGQGGGTGGGQSDLLMQVVGGLLGGQGGQGGGGLGGLAGLLGQLQQGGLGEAVQSWVGTGANLPVSGDQLSAALGHGKVAELAQQVGLSPDVLGGQLAQLLPQVIDKMTPDGQVPAAGAAMPDMGSLLAGALGGLLGNKG